MKIFLFTLLFFSLVCAEVLRMAEIREDLAPIYPRPSDSLPPLLMARAKQVFPVYGSSSDDSGRIWFCIRARAQAPDSGWVLADGVRFISISRDSTLALKRRETLDQKEKKRRYDELRKHPDWPRRIRQAVRNGEIVLDMTEEQLRASWADPLKIFESFMVGIGKYRIFYYAPSDRKSSICVTLQDKRVSGWSED